jgi:hypothetical protein
MGPTSYKLTWNTYLSPPAAECTVISQDSATWNITTQVVSIPTPPGSSSPPSSSVSGAGFSSIVTSPSSPADDYLDDNDLLIWPFPPNWEEGVLERLEWKTDAFISETGAEQRVSKRRTPRRSFEASFVLNKVHRQFFEMLMNSHMPDRWLLPVWHEGVQISNHSLYQHGGGGSVIHGDFTDADYRVGSYVVVRDRATQDYELLKIRFVADDQIVTVTERTTTWSIGSIVCPTVIGELESEINYKKKSDQFAYLQSRFNLAQVNWDGAGYASTHRHRYVFVYNQRPDDSEDLTFARALFMEQIDNEIGIPKRFRLNNSPVYKGSHRWSFAGRDKAKEFRKLLYYMRGKARALWFPTFMDDMTLTTDIVSIDQNLKIKNIGYTRLGIFNTGLIDIQIELFDGTKYCRRIVGSTEDSATEETIGLEETVPDTNKDSVRQISFMRICRFDQDGFEINHKGNAKEGLVQTLVNQYAPVEATPQDVLTDSAWLISGNNVAGSMGLTDGNKLGTIGGVLNSYPHTYFRLNGDAWAHNGKRYWEVEIDDSSSSANDVGWVGLDTGNGRIMFGYNGFLYHNLNTGGLPDIYAMPNTANPWTYLGAVSYSGLRRFGFAADVDKGLVWLRVDGTWVTLSPVNVGNPDTEAWPIPVPKFKGPIRPEFVICAHFPECTARIYTQPGEWADPAPTGYIPIYQDNYIISGEF